MLKRLLRLFDWLFPPIKFNLAKKTKPTNEELDKKADEVLQELARRNKRGK